ncbi:MAG: penicillin-binding transpeptidase domain-containing protein, partial [Bacteroidota bacterium]
LAFKGLPVKVMGKTGTAQNPHGPSHGWFVGLAPAESPRLVVVVLVEHGTSGSLAAAPVARKIFETFFGVKPEAASPAPGAAAATGD